MGESNLEGRAGSGPLRICVTGAECTGKTTLAMALARHYSAPIVREYCRDYFSEKLACGDASVHTADIVRITTEQARREDAAAMWSGPLIICDTDVFTVTTWSPLYLHERMKPELDAMVTQRRLDGRGIDLYLLCSPDIPFQVDGLRTGGQLRKEMHPVFLERLGEKQLPFVEVSGKPSKRFADSLKAIDRMLSLTPSAR